MRLTLNQCQNIDPKGALHGSALVECLQNRIRVCRFIELDHNPHAMSIGFIPQIADAIQCAISHKLRNFFNERGFIRHVGQFSHNNALPAAAHFFQPDPGAHFDTAFSAAV